MGGNKMDDFQFCLSTRLIFGQSALSQIPEQMRGVKKALLHYGGNSIIKSGLLAHIETVLKQAGIPYVALGGVRPQPDLELVRNGIQLCKAEKIDFILAAGGGSVIDSAKAIATGVKASTDVWDVLINKAAYPGSIPVGVVLTIPAAGSESSTSCVITNYETRMKVSFNHEAIRPSFCAMNPEWFFTLPDNQVANGITDMLSHIFERYFTTTPATELVDCMAEGVMKTIVHHAPIVVSKRDDYNAWSQLGLAASIAHNNILGIGRKQIWVCHGMANPLSAKHGIAHGAALAAITPVWMRYVYRKERRFFARFATQVMEINPEGMTDEQLAEAGINKFTAFLKEIGAPADFKYLKLSEEEIKRLAASITFDSNGNDKPLASESFYPMHYQDVLKIYQAIL